MSETGKLAPLCRKAIENLKVAQSQNLDLLMNEIREEIQPNFINEDFFSIFNIFSLIFK